MALTSKIDLVMWTKNGGETLAPVLRRIGEVIPVDHVNKRLIVDDQSTDDTCEIAESLGWQVVSNEGKGIGDGANTALRHVEADCFVSFEQDLLLSRDWWSKIPRHLSDPKVAVASGIRFDYCPAVVRKIQEYTAERYRLQEKAGKFSPYAKTLDNTIYRTEAVRGLGGFPKTAPSAGVDNVLAQRVYAGGFEWKVDYSVRSTHLRRGLQEELAHNYWYGTSFSTLSPLLLGRSVNMKPIAIRVFLSPLRGLEIALKKDAAQAVYIYPLMRFAMLKGIADGLRRSQHS